MGALQDQREHRLAVGEGEAEIPLARLGDRARAASGRLIEAKIAANRFDIVGGHREVAERAGTGSPGTIWMIRKVRIRMARIARRAQQAAEESAASGERAHAAPRASLSGAEARSARAHRRLVEMRDVEDREHWAAARGAEHWHDEGRRLLLGSASESGSSGRTLGERGLPREASAVDEAKLERVSSIFSTSSSTTSMSAMSRFTCGSSLRSGKNWSSVVRPAERRRKCIPAC